MSNISTNGPMFLVPSDKRPLIHKLMFIRKNGKAMHLLGDVSRSMYEAELICISDEDDENWIGNYAEGMGLHSIKFAKEDCREATPEEVEAWIKDAENFKF